MAAGTGEQRWQMQEEFENLRVQMMGALQNEREQRGRLRQQYTEEISLMQNTIRIQEEEKSKMLGSVFGTFFLLGAASLTCCIG